MTDRPSHTPEPWHCQGRTTLYAMPDASDAITMIELRANVTEAGWDTVAFIEAIWPGADANARRICAAVNACQGISTEALERGIVAEARQALAETHQLLAARQQIALMYRKCRKTSSETDAAEELATMTSA